MQNLQQLSANTLRQFTNQAIPQSFQPQLQPQQQARQPPQFFQQQPQPQQQAQQPPQFLQPQPQPPQQAQQPQPQQQAQQPPQYFRPPQQAQQMMQRMGLPAQGAQCPKCERGSRVIVYVTLLTLAILLLVFASVTSFNWSMTWLFALLVFYVVTTAIFL